MSTNEPAGQYSPKPETIRISLDPEPGAAPPVPQSPMPQRSSGGGLGVVLAIVGAIFALGFVGVGMLTCAGVAFFLFSADRSSAEYEAQTVYSPPVYDPPDYVRAYPEPPSETSSYFYDPIVSGDPYDPGTTSSDLGTTAYDPSLYVAPATPEYAPVAEATAGATPFSVEPVSDDYWRAITLENEIAEDEAKLADLDAQLAVTGVAGGVGGIAVQEGETVDDQVAGLILGVGANAIAQQLQSERDAVVIRLNANRTALAELRAAGY